MTGTVSDGSMVRCIERLKERGYKVHFTPFLLMDVPPPDPNPFPWRGRITGNGADVDGFFTRTDGYLRFVRHCLAGLRTGNRSKTFLYDWWPIFRRRHLYRRLAAATVELKSYESENAR